MSAQRSEQRRENRDHDVHDLLDRPLRTFLHSITPPFVHSIQLISFPGKDLFFIDNELYGLYELFILQSIFFELFPDFSNYLRKASLLSNAIPAVYPSNP